MKRVLLAVALSAVLVGCADREGTPSATGPALQPGDPGAGKILAERDCKGCHGLDGKGAAPGIPHLAAQSERYLHASIQAYLEGRRTHAALRDMIAGMSEADVRNVVAFYSGLPAVPVAAGASAPRFLPYEHGKALAADCARCHGADGAGTTIAPPLWGAGSYNIGAGMSRLRTAASFIRHNMPQDRPGTLTDQQAFDLAKFVNSHSRPDYALKHLDWPNGDPPPDVAYETDAGRKPR